MRHFKPVLFVAATFAALVAVAVPASADPGATIDSVDREDCVLTINITVQDAGTYYLVVWDDGEIIGTDSVEAAEGASTSLTFTIVQNVNAGSAGLGLTISDDATGGGADFDTLDPYDFEGSDDIAKACEEGGGVLTTTTTEGPSTTVGETSTTAAAPVTTAPANAPANTPAPAPAPAAAAPAQAVAAQAAYTG